MTAPSRTSSREFSVRGWSGSSGGRPSSRPSFQWLPSTREWGKARVRVQLELSPEPVGLEGP